VPGSGLRYCIIREFFATLFTWPENRDFTFLAVFIM